MFIQLFVLFHFFIDHLNVFHKTGFIAAEITALIITFCWLFYKHLAALIFPRCALLSDIITCDICEAEITSAGQKYVSTRILYPVHAEILEIIHVRRRKFAAVLCESSDWLSITYEIHNKDIFP